MSSSGKKNYAGDVYYLSILCQFHGKSEMFKDSRCIGISAKTSRLNPSICSSSELDFGRDSRELTVLLINLSGHSSEIKFVGPVRSCLILATCDNGVHSVLWSYTMTF
jgi:hypothetical protein